MTTTQARKDWAKLLRLAQKGSSIVITSHGKPVAVVVSVATYETMPKSPKTVAEAMAEWRATIDPRELEGPDPWANIRDKSPTGGRTPITFED